MTRRTFVFGILALALTAVESALLAACGLVGSGMLLSLGILFLAALRAGDIEGAAIAAIVGFGWDVFSGVPTGLSVAPAVGIFVGVRMLSQGVEVAGVLQIAFLGFFATFLHGLACMGLLAFAGSMGELSFWPSIYILLRQALVASLLVAPIFKFVCWLDRFLVDDKAESGVWLS